MEKVVSLVWILVVSISVIQVQSSYFIGSDPYKPVQEKSTRLLIYAHDTQSGKTPTAVRIAGPQIKKNKPAAFGTTFAIDDPLTEGPDIKSKVVGNMRGMYVSASQDKNLMFVMYADLGFTTGKFENSSLSVFSRNPVTETNREMAVVGGRGLFKFAKGVVYVKTLIANFTSGDAILEYNVEVVHPCDP